MLMLQKQPHPALALPADGVPQGENVRGLIGSMRAEMYIHKGIGLAANQVGVLKRVIVLDVSGFRLNLINPRIIKRYGGTTTKREGCLSVVGQHLKVRHRKIIVEGYDENWQLQRRKLKGLTAACVQHEVDHLDGVCINDL